MRTLNIGLVAYGVDRSMVMVRVPNERGRWLATDRCVVEVDCAHCGAVTGEPCRKWLGSTYYRRHGIERPTMDPSDIRYGVGVHCVRKYDAKRKHGGSRYTERLPPHKLRITASELAELQKPAEEWPDIQVHVTRREPER